MQLIYHNDFHGSRIVFFYKTNEGNKWKRGELPFNGDISVLFQAIGKQFNDLEKLQTYVEVANQM